MERARSSELRHNLQVIESLRDRMKQVRAWWQHPDTDLATKERLIQDRLGSRIGAANASDFLAVQTGIDDCSGWALSQEDLDTLPPRAIARMREATENRTRNLWPILLLTDPTRQEQVNQYLTAAHQVAQTLGCFPYRPSCEAIPLQRSVHYKHRELFAQLLYFQSLFTYHNAHQASVSHLSLLQGAVDTYRTSSLPDLQHMLEKKASLSAAVIQELTNTGSWNDPEQLALMCVDRGLRTVVIDYYPHFRTVTLPTPVSGYHTGQIMQATTAQLSDIRADLSRRVLMTI